MIFGTSRGERAKCYSAETWTKLGGQTVEASNIGQAFDGLLPAPEHWSLSLTCNNSHSVLPIVTRNNNDEPTLQLYNRQWTQIKNNELTIQVPSFEYIVTCTN